MGLSLNFDDQQPGAPAHAIRRILIIKWSALGDVAIATAMMEDIRRAFPCAVIHLNTLPSAARLFAHDPRFETIISVDVRNKTQRLRRNVEWLSRVRSGQYDLVIDLQGSDHTRLLLTLLLVTGHRIPHRLGIRRGFPYTVCPARDDPNAHAFVRMRSLLAAAGIPAGAARPVLFASDADVAAARETMKRAGLLPRRFAVFLPGSQAEGWLKRWGAARYTALAKLLIGPRVDKIAIIGGPEEVEECARIADAINSETGGSAINLNMLPLLQIAPICAAAQCIVANDTGNAHIAAASGRPMVVICGPTDPRRVKPLGASVRAVQTELTCVNCYRKTCRIAPAPSCMAAITPEHIDAILTHGSKEQPGIRIFE